MPYPHDYYHDYEPHPELHNRGEDRPYLEPDYYGHGMDASLPVLSAIGRGPRGEGLYVGNVINQDGVIKFSLISSLTGEVVWTSPNLAPQDISFESKPFQEVYAGVHNPLDIYVNSGGSVTKHTAYIPSGATGSLVFLLDEAVARTIDDTYVTTVGELTIYGRKQYQNKPNPRPNDIVFFKFLDNGKTGFAFGTIENVGGTTRYSKGTDPVSTETNVVFTARTFIKMPDVEIDENGNWVIDGVSTGIRAKGEKGDKGDKGDPGKDGISIVGPKGPKGDDGLDANVRVGETVQLRPGQSAYVEDMSDDPHDALLKFGIPEGRPAKIEEVTIETGEPGTQASVETRVISEKDNKYGLDLVIPRGEDGAPLDFQNGVYTLEDLPPYTPTPMNTAFVVDDGDGAYDLYIRGRIPVDAEDGGPWVVIEDWGYPHINVLTEAEMGAIVAQVVADRS